MSIRLDPIQHLPEELSVRIFSFLDVQSFGRCCHVSRRWHKIAKDQSLWKRVFPQGSFLSGFSREYLSTHAVNAEDKLVERLRTFVEKIPKGQTGLFQCLFPLNPECTMRVDMGVSFGFLNEPKREPDHKEITVFTKRFPSEYQDLDEGAMIRWMGAPEERKIVLLRYRIKIQEREVESIMQSQLAMLIDDVLESEVRRRNSTGQQLKIIFQIAVVGMVALGVLVLSYYSRSTNQNVR